MNNSELPEQFDEQRLPYSPRLIHDRYPTKRRQYLRGMVIAGMTATGLVGLGSTSVGATTGTGGPVILMGLDSELDPGDSSHGTRAEHAAMVQALLGNVTNGGSGILVIGASGFTQTYWNNVGTDVGQAVTFVEGASNIEVVDFDGYAMIGVASSDFEMFGQGGLTNAENDALVDRAVDIAAFVNAGGGLLGKTQDGLSNPWGYIAAFGLVETRSNDFSSVTVEQAGLDLGLTQAGMDGWCCYHETFTEFPAFLDVLITNNHPGTAGFGEPAALGGQTVVIVPEGCVDLIAGQGTPVGEVCVVNDDDELTVTYSTTEECVLTETHLAISTDEPGSGEWTANRWQNRPGNPAPGRFPYQGDHDPAEETVTYTIPLTDISGGVESGDLLYIGAHAVVDCDDHIETAWGEGDRFVQRGNWAMYFTFEVR